MLVVRDGVGRRHPATQTGLLPRELGAPVRKGQKSKLGFYPPFMDTCTFESVSLSFFHCTVYVRGEA